MRKVAEKNLFRIIDANFNRAKEGLRVCEDICRFWSNKKKVTRTYKQIRHQLTKEIARLKIVRVIEARDIRNDVGRGSLKSELKRRDIRDIFYANSQRVKESIRVLEELAKLFDKKLAQALKRLRYKVYKLEQEIISTL